MKEIPAIYCDIDGVLNTKLSCGVVDKDFTKVGALYDRFGEPNENMIRILEVLGQSFTIVFITGRWAMGQERVEKHVNYLLPNIKKVVFCKSYDYQGTTAEYKIEIIKELEKQGYKFYLGLDDHSAVIGLMHNHKMFVAHVLSD